MNIGFGRPCDFQAKRQTQTQAQTQYDCSVQSSPVKVVLPPSPIQFDEHDFLQTDGLKVQIDPRAVKTQTTPVGEERKTQKIKSEVDDFPATFQIRSPRTSLGSPKFKYFKGN
jgi:hypothetical protein